MKINRDSFLLFAALALAGVLIVFPQTQKRAPSTARLFPAGL